MLKIDVTLKATLLAIALFLGMIAFRPFINPPTTVMAQPARFDHVFIVSTTFLYKGMQGLLVLDRRNGNVWLLPRVNDSFQDPLFIMRMQFEKLDRDPQ
jgi:hypothetical protein